MDLYPLFEVQKCLKLIGSNSWSPNIRIQQPPFLSGLCGTISLTTCKVREPTGLVVKSFAQKWTMFWCLMLIGFLRGAVIPLMFPKVPQSSLGILRAPFTPSPWTPPLKNPTICGCFKKIFWPLAGSGWFIYHGSLRNVVRPINLGKILQRKADNLSVQNVHVPKKGHFGQDLPKKTGFSQRSNQKQLLRCRFTLQFLLWSSPPWHDGGKKKNGKNKYLHLPQTIFGLQPALFHLGLGSCRWFLLFKKSHLK